MATRGTIGYETLDGEYRGVYVHYDSYPQHIVPILSEMMMADVAIMVERAISSGGIRVISDGGKFELFNDDSNGDVYEEWPCCPEEFAYRKCLDGRVEWTDDGETVQV